MPAANLAGFTHVFKADIAVNRPRRGTRRARQPVSCQLCRTRKLKCDREHPVCGSCLKRGDRESCSYLPASASGVVTASGPTARNGNRVGPGRGPRPRQEVQTRLQQLEQLVSGLLSNDPATHDQSAISPPESTSSSTDLASTPNTGAGVAHASSAATGGHISRSGLEMPFVGATHWTAILESIHDIRDCLEEAEGEPEGDTSPTEPRTAELLDPIFGLTEPITTRAVMAALPSRLKADKMLGIYEKGQFTSAPILHTQQFRRQYESFWSSPASTSLLWVSILFSSLAMAVLDAIPLVGEEVVRAQQRFYTTKAVQCLVAGGYLQAKPLAVEALVMYTLTRVSERNDADPYLWSFFSVAVRLAQRMGYHRDPTQINAQRITPFQAEMRRRTWFLLEAFDLMYSMQLGMPTVIQDDQCDVAAPTNLHDEDFDEDSAALPPARPDTDPTKALYFRYKSRLVRQMRRIVLHALSVRSRGYEETLELHRDLEALHDNIPPPLRVTDIHGVVAAAGPDHMKSLVHRLALELMYLKALCLLHRPYLTRRKDDTACEFSRRVCRLAALKILKLGAELEVEVEPCGNLFERGYLLGTLTLHDFLIAAMVLCLDLNETTGLSREERETELQALRLAYSDWSSRSSTSRDAAHAKKVLGAMLRKVSKATAITDAAATTAPTALGTLPNEPTEPPLSPILAGQAWARRRPQRAQPNREMPWIGHDFVSPPGDRHAAAAAAAAAAASTSRIPDSLPEFLRQGSSDALGPRIQGLLSTMRYLDFSDLEVAEPPTNLAGGQDDLSSLLDNTDEIDWNMVDSYLLDRDGDMEIASEGPAHVTDYALNAPPLWERGLYMYGQPLPM